MSDGRAAERLEPHIPETPTRDELLQELRTLAKSRDGETAHVRADVLLIRYINDEEIARAFHDIRRWYS